MSTIKEQFETLNKEKLNEEKLEKTISTDDEVLFTNKWVTVKETSDEYTYIEGIPGVTILPYREIEEGPMELLIRDEFCPLFGNFITVVTGRSDEGEKYLETAQRELLEETGLEVTDMSKFIDRGDLILSKDRPMPDRIFLVDVTGIKQTEPEGDGTVHEEKSENIWITEDEIPEYIEKSQCNYFFSVLLHFIVGIRNGEKT